MRSKVLLIGGSSKVGRSIIKKIDTKKNQIYSSYNKKIIAKLKNKNIYQYQLDLENNNSKNNFLKKINRNLNVIILLSAILNGKSLSSYNSEEIERNMNINFTSQISLLNEILKKQKKNCLIVIISSISGRRGSFDPIYASGKGALISFVKSMSKWSAPNFRFIGLCPGLIENTKMFKTFKTSRLKKLLKENPNKEFLNSDDLADIILDIIKPHWRHANGSIIDLNGGIF